VHKLRDEITIRNFSALHALSRPRLDVPKPSKQTKQLLQEIKQKAGAGTKVLFLFFDRTSCFVYRHLMLMTQHLSCGTIVAITCTLSLLVLVYTPPPLPRPPSDPS
jgi:hypothetical protein